MSSPELPHILLPEIPIPIFAAYGALLLIAATSFYQYRKHQDSGAGLFGLLALGGVGWLYTSGAKYFDPADPLTIKPFGALVALGVYLGSVVARRHAKERGLDLAKMDSFIVYVVGWGFVGGHVLDAVFYTPEKLASNPLYILQLWAGLSSYGGFIGAIFGALLFKYTKNEKVLPFVDTVCSAFPLAWVFGRAGCSVAHDHPGMVSDAWYAVKCAAEAPRYQGTAFLCSHLPEGLGRLDLGLIEFVATVPLAIGFYFAWRAKPRSYGFFAGWMSVLYAPVRFGMDFLRVQEGAGHEGDPRHWGLTPAQYACFGLLALGVYLLKLSKNYPAPETYASARALEGQAQAKVSEVEDEDEDEDDFDDDDDLHDAADDSAHGKKRPAPATKAPGSKAGPKDGPKDDHKDEKKQDDSKE